MSFSLHSILKLTILSFLLVGCVAAKPHPKGHRDEAPTQNKNRKLINAATSLVCDFHGLDCGQANHRLLQKKMNAHDVPPTKTNSDDGLEECEEECSDPSERRQLLAAVKSAIDNFSDQDKRELMALIENHQMEEVIQMMGMEDLPF